MNLDHHIVGNRQRSWSTPSPIVLIIRFFNTLITWQQRIEERRQLLEMSDRMIRDIGLNRNDILREANKPFWRP